MPLRATRGLARAAGRPVREVGLCVAGVAVPRGVLRELIARFAGRGSLRGRCRRRRARLRATSSCALPRGHEVALAAHAGPLLRGGHERAGWQRRAVVPRQRGVRRGAPSQRHGQDWRYSPARPLGNGHLVSWRCARETARDRSAQDYGREFDDEALEVGAGSQGYRCEARVAWWVTRAGVLTLSGREPSGTPRRSRVGSIHRSRALCRPRTHLLDGCAGSMWSDCTVYG